MIRSGIYYKEPIPLIRRDDLCTLDSCLVTEIRTQSKKCFLACAYCSPSQSQKDFDFFSNFDILLSQINDAFPLCSILTGDFNALYTNW